MLKTYNIIQRAFNECKIMNGKKGHQNGVRMQLKQVFE